jgi:hypothetical protein
MTNVCQLLLSLSKVGLGPPWIRVWIELDREQRPRYVDYRLANEGLRPRGRCYNCNRDHPERKVLTLHCEANVPDTIIHDNEDKKQVGVLT